MRWPGATPSERSAFPARLTWSASSAYVTSPAAQRIATLAPRPSTRWRSMKARATLKPGSKLRTEGDCERSMVRCGITASRDESGPCVLAFVGAAGELAEGARGVLAGDGLAPAEVEVGVLHRLGD